MVALAVTGVSGHLGQVLLRRLAAAPDVERVVGIDARDPKLRPPKLEFHRADIATADLKPLFDRVDALAHLAFLIAPQRDESIMARVNVEGTRRVFEAAANAGVRTIVYVSSAMVYGAWPDNPVPISEDAPLRPNPAFAYASHKAETERLASEWREDHPGASVAVLRPVTVVGPSIDNWVARVFHDGLPVGLRLPNPPVQYVHEDDVAAAIDLAWRAGLDGEFNVAPDGWIPGDEVRALSARRLQVRLPANALHRVTAASWAVGLGEIPPTVLPYFEHPWVVANDRLEAAGWEPRHTNEEAFVAGSAPGAWQSLTARHRQQLALGGAAAGALGLAAGAVAAYRRFSSRGASRG
jgi:nucleoside-diphosphate-sugar epimerase